jgi:hypothetical protein
MHAHVNGGLQRAREACEAAGPLGAVQTLAASND